MNLTTLRQKINGSTFAQYVNGHKVVQGKGPLHHLHSIWSNLAIITEAASLYVPEFWEDLQYDLAQNSPPLFARRRNGRCQQIKVEQDKTLYVHDHYAPTSPLWQNEDGVMSRVSLPDLLFGSEPIKQE